MVKVRYKVREVEKVPLYYKNCSKVWLIDGEKTFQTLILGNF